MNYYLSDRILFNNPKKSIITFNPSVTSYIGVIIDIKQFINILSQSFLIYRIHLPQLIISQWKDKKILALKKLKKFSGNKNHIGMKANQNWRLLMRRKKVLILLLMRNKSLNLKTIFLEMIFRCKNKTQY